MSDLFCTNYGIGVACFVQQMEIKPISFQNPAPLKVPEGVDLVIKDASKNSF